MLEKKRAYLKVVSAEALNKPDLSGTPYVDQNIEVAEHIVENTVKQIKLAFRIGRSEPKEAEQTVEAKIIDSDNTEFDLEAEIKQHPDSLFVKCFAIEADEPNDNGDFFSREELKKSTPSFVGVPVFTNHANNDVNQARGKVVHSWWDDERNGIVIIARVDAAAYPQLARGIKEKYIIGTSMGCQVQYSLCSICHNYAENPDEYCFEGHTHVLMSDCTVKEISQISIGDEVLDAFGNHTKVTKLFKRRYTGKAIKLQSRAIPDCLICTPNHPFLVINKNQYKYFPAEFLADNQQLLTPIPVVKEDNSLFEKIGYSQWDIDKKRKFVRLLGYYGAEGNRVIRNGKIRAVEFNLNKKETSFSKEINEICEELFGRTAQVYPSKHTNGMFLRFWHPEVAQKICTLCPGIVHRERSKRFDPSVFTLPKELIAELLGAFIDGDGYAAKNGSVVAVSACPGLASQIYYLFQILHASPAIGRYENGLNKAGDQLFAYRISLGNSQIEKMCKSGDKIIKASLTKAVKQSKLTNCITEDLRFSKHNAFNIEEIGYDDFVYNFETESHSYVAENTSVHNCSHIRERKTRTISSNRESCKYHEHGTEDECPICHSKKGETKKLAVIEKKVFEYNYGIRFIENSFVVNPACHRCGVLEVIDPSRFVAKVANLKLVLPNLWKQAEKDGKVCVGNCCIKTAGQQEITDLRSALELLAKVSQNMLHQKEQVDLEFLSDLVKVMADLQAVTDELTEQGYGKLPAPGEEGQSPQPNAEQGANPMPAAQAVNPTPGGGSKVINGPAAGGVGTVTGPATAASRKLLDKYSLLKNSNILLGSLGQLLGQPTGKTTISLKGPILTAAKTLLL